MANVIEITDFTTPELDVYARLTEAQLLNREEPAKGLFIAESPKVIERALDAGCQPVSLLMERRHIDSQAKAVIARCGDIPVYTSDLDILTKLTGFQLTRGVLCAMRRPALKSVEETLQDSKRIVILENVMNPTNVGAIFRSAAALGMDAVLLTPGCSNPLYRRAARVSMGTVFQIPWTFIGSSMADWPEDGIQKLRSLGFKTAAMALRDDSVSIDDPKLLAEEKLAIILGSEGDGLTNDTIADCDYTVRIPMYHDVDSLNVAAASAVAFWQLRNRT
ncbi:MAG: RNA methyltransferase [Oscillospiraceae bacterium]|nr:RNA methyltransferase [Oscillospiraceae bacterium]